MPKRWKKSPEDIKKRFNREKLLNTLAQPGPNSFIMVLDGLKPNFNIGKIFRSAEAFGALEIHLIGVEYFDTTPAKGSFKHVPASFHDSFDACYQQLKEKGYTLYTLEPGSGNSLPATTLPQKSAFILGHEEFGLSVNKEDYPDLQGLTIPQWGKVQSLNVSIAASIVMYEYIHQHHA